MATLPLKSPRNEQHAVVRFCGQKDSPHPPCSPDLAPSDYRLFWADEENARWAEIRIRYGSVISRSSVAWTAASTVLCIGHSEAC